MEAKERESHRPKRGTILPKSGVMGFTVKRKPTWMTLPRIAVMKTIASTGSVILMNQLMNADISAGLSAFGSVAMERKYTYMSAHERRMPPPSRPRAEVPASSTSAELTSGDLATLPSSRALRILCSEGSSVLPSSSAANHWRGTSKEVLRSGVKASMGSIG